MGNPGFYERTLVLLANSRRPQGRCVAGKIWPTQNGTWIRPINTQNHHAISEGDLHFEDGTSADVLDIVTIPFIVAAPIGHQTENENITSDYYWSKVGRATWAEVVAATDIIAGPLWSNASGDSYHGTNDKVDAAHIAGIHGSLALIQPINLRLFVASESIYGGGNRRKVRACFQYSGAAYNFVVTDPLIEAQYLAGANGVYPIPDSRICVSLAEVFNGIATKLVASIITPQRAA